MLHTGEIVFRWLHLSDIHVGMTDEHVLWPTFKHALFDDFSTLFSKIGGPDVIIFSGDVAQLGQRAEYNRFTDILGEIREKLSTHGSSPPLVAVPGNHDLTRPKAGGLLEAAMRQVPADEAVLRQVFDVGGDYKKMIADAFGNFTAWQDDLIESGQHLPPISRGPIPGDAAFELTKDGEDIGIVTLNSAWLQLAAGDYRGRLHVDPRQINGCTADDPEGWCRSKNVRLVVSHHPLDWLTAPSRELWNAEIAPVGRFDLHLYGHMHVHAATATVFGGSGSRRQLQGSSVFGLEYVDGQKLREHGYAAVEIGDRYGSRQISVWPRILKQMRSGRRSIVPDHDLELGEDNSFSWPLHDRVDSRKLAPKRVSIDEASRPDGKTSAKIEATRLHLEASPAHAVVRRIEQGLGKAALKDDGVLWISRDWGVGEDGFVWSLLSDGAESESPIFRLDLERYATREQFLGELRSELGCSFEELCEYLSTLDAAVLLLDNAPQAGAGSAGAMPIERDLEEIARIVREFAPTSIVILRGRPRASAVRRPLVELHPFDEPDVADYVRAHELGGERYAKPAVVSRLWEHAGGSPVRLDAILADLKYTNLDDLLGASTTYGEPQTDVGVPAALVGTIRELSKSGVAAWDRAFQLLEALTALPRGEQLERMRRFLGVHPFFPSHARELSTRGLIEVVQLSGMTSGDTEAAPKTLVVPRIVYDFVRNQMSSERRRELDSKALELYFGSDWRAGDIGKSPSGKRCAQPLCETYEVTNACAIVERTLAQAAEEGDTIKLEASIRLASAFVEVLQKGDHFQAAAQLCERALALVPPEGNEQRVDIIRYALARSIRMLGQRSKAAEIFNSLDRGNLSKTQRRSVDLEMALIHEHKDDAEAARFAKQVLKGGKSDGRGLQARTILAEQEQDKATRLAELSLLEELARKNGSTIAANNIALSRASDDEDPLAAIEHLDRVIASAEADGDFFNGTKAIIRRMRFKRGVSEQSADNVDRLIRAYQHLHNERGSSLFDQSHDALWGVFRSAGDPENLLRLFRHSSLIWRLRGEEVREDSFLDEIGRFVSEATTFPGLSRELAYYRSRAAASLERRTVAKPSALPSS